MITLTCTQIERDFKKVMWAKLVNCTLHPPVGNHIFLEYYTAAFEFTSFPVVYDKAIERAQ